MGTDNPSQGDSGQSPEFIGHSAHDARLVVDTTPTSRVTVPETSIRGSAHDARLAVDTTPTSRVTVPETPIQRSVHDASLAVDTTPTSRVEVSAVPSAAPVTQDASAAGDQQ
jgi:hypothetical protein